MLEQMSLSHRDPEFVIFTGPMFSSKTSKLISAIDRYKYQSRNVAVFKSRMDSRYDRERILTHSGIGIDAICVSHGHDLMRHVDEMSSCDVIALDEAFMIDGVASILLDFYRSGKTIVVSSIQLSASGLPFDEMKEMMPYATKIEVCPAVCLLTGRDAYYTKRKQEGLNEIAVGGSDMYFPVCWEQHHFMNKRD